MPAITEPAREIKDSFTDLLDIVTPTGGPVAMLRAYFDASQRDSGVFTIAGYMFDSSQARKFRREMQLIFEEYGGLHTTDLVALGGNYLGRLNRTQSNDLIRQVVPIIRSRITCGVVASCWVQDVHNHSPRWIRGFGHPYAICCHLAMTALGIWARDHAYRDGIAYVFESGDRFAGEAHEMMSVAATQAIVQQNYQYRSHAFLGKDDADASPIQAADFLAWEWGKFFEETLSERKRPMRMSLAHLLNHQLHKYTFNPMYGPRFLAFLDDIRNLGIEELQERHAPVDINMETEVANATSDDQDLQ